MAGRTHQRLQQYYKGVPVVGADVTRQLDGVLEQALNGVPPGVSDLARWVRLARFSVTVNATVSARAVGRKVPLGPLAAQAFRLGPAGLIAYLRYSRLVERSVARMRAGVGAPPKPVA